MSNLATKFSQQITINIVCGYEIITVNSGETNPLKYERTLDRTLSETFHTWSNLQTLFSSNIGVCPVTSIAKFKISSNTAYNNDYLTLSETTDSSGAKSYAINVNKIYSYVHKFSIRAATAGVTADMEVTFTVCGTEKILAQDLSEWTLKPAWAENEFHISSS